MRVSVFKEEFPNKKLLKTLDLFDGKGWIKFFGFDRTFSLKEIFVVYANQVFTVVDSNNYQCSKGHWWSTH